VLSVAQLDRDPGKPNRHAWHDVGLATENLMLQATSMNVAVHAMGGFDAQKAREVLAIPDRWEPVAMIAIGYPGDPRQLGEDLKKKDLAPRVRKPIEEFVFPGRWGSKS
jgi:nitroreductase